ncbi:phosphonate metabolism protein PhnM [Paraburkholderia caffeinilytica]|uniref:Phosphonate metabolism protein PhnM n=1 Tax=Paraburkholderia caffeinilytica TaxID=1761016 RepID=A0ABQ1NBK9_9BURK|nr:alpha-D-ribose 1-methylphosphonate 5-triphosphate diphosphatase [Paraburkholderia caffeinilytica]AXL49076.1 phosphonate metabolism protein PhnM [Paraburkholderia caffeinilytica]GGC56667.1 phosphonate metabolism protein PhnM [Paraburkholderia caffeinilytica]CAB3807166.1 Alpha-D-ribose 1-methylphosphonate 5-triphosphate diphosphatase [Paraburkholderia caffeinilytica]
MLIRNARIVTRDEVFTGVIRIEDGVIRDVERGTTSAREAEDWDGDYLLPGLIELHTDNLEKHLVPRPGVQWNTDAAFVIHDAQVAAAGITTVFDALAIGSRSNVGLRGRDMQMQCAESLARFAERKLLRAEHFLHLRCEIATADVVELFDSLCTHPLLRLASVMDHTPGQRQWHDHEQWRRFQERNGKLTDEHVATALAELSVEQERYADAHRHAIVARCNRLGIPVASHDDTLIEHIEQAKAEGIVLAEFPTTRIAAEAAREHGISTIMGAPNIVRGGSHSGNVSALELAKAGLLDILSSDYVPSSLMTAVFDLVNKAGWTLPRAMATVSAEPARTAGLHDRGAIEAGLRADFVRVTMLDALPVPRATYRTGARIV